MSTKADQPKKHFMWQRIAFWTLLISFIFSIIITSTLTTLYLLKRNQIISQAKNQALLETQKAAQKIDNFLKILKPIVDSFTSELNVGNWNKQTILNRIQTKAINVTGIGVAFTPFAFDPKIQLYAPYFTERDGKQQLLQIEKFYNYTQPQYDRYNTPLKVGQGVFLEPFFDPASNTILAEYSAPFYNLQLQPAGVVFANHSTEHIQFVLEDLQLGKKGYAFVISKKGTYVAHPEKRFVRSLKTIFDLADEMKNEELEKMGKKAIAGEHGYIDHKNIITGQDSWMFFEPIPSAGWSMVTVFIKDEIQLNTLELQRSLINLIFCFLLCFFLLGLLIIRVYKGGKTRLWFGSTLFSLIISASIIFILSIAVDKVFYTAREEISIHDRTGLNQFLETISKKTVLKKDIHAEHKMPPPTAPKKPSVHVHPEPTAPQPETVKKDVHAEHKMPPPTAPKKPPVHVHPKPTAPQPETTKKDIHAEHKMPPPTAPKKPAAPAHAAHGVKIHRHEEHLHVPTGIYIEGLNFTQNRSVEIMGQIWQRYHKKTHKHLTKEVIFPQATLLNEWRLQKAYQYDSDNWETIGWNFIYVLAQEFSYDNYPFDAKIIKVWLEAKDFDKGVTLVPDFDSYKIINPRSLPGVNRLLPLPNWNLEQSYFSYKEREYDTNFGFYTTGPFGIIEKSTKGDIPDLYFNIIASRSIINTLIIDLFPLIIILIILFITIMMASRSKLEFGRVLAICTSVFFSVIIAHLRFKTTLPTPEVVFFEYFYFIIHFIILSVSLVSIFYFLKVKITLIQYENMLIPRLLYWPLLTILILIVSIVYFY